MRNRRRNSGYSLFELLVTLAVAAIVLGVGMPSFGKMTAEHRLRTEADALFHAIHLARKESVVRRRVVTLCSSLDGISCGASNDWSAGWIVFVNRSRAAESIRSEDEELLAYHQVSETTTIRANRQAFSLRATDLRATNGTLILCDTATRAEARALVISYTGRPRVSRSETSGKPWSCAD